MKKILWLRKLSCGHERATNIAFKFKEYDKPKVGEECYCRECCSQTKIIAVEECSDSNTETNK